MLTVHNFEIFTDGSIFACGIDAFNFALLGIYVLVIFAADVCKYRRIKKCALSSKSSTGSVRWPWWRWAC